MHIMKSNMIWNYFKVDPSIGIMVRILSNFKYDCYNRFGHIKSNSVKKNNLATEEDRLLKLQLLHE